MNGMGKIKYNDNKKTDGRQDEMIIVLRIIAFLCLA